MEAGAVIYRTCVRELAQEIEKVQGMKRLPALCCSTDHRLRRRPRSSRAAGDELRDGQLHRPAQ